MSDFQHYEVQGGMLRPKCTAAKVYLASQPDGALLRGKLTKPRSVTFNNGAHKLCEFLIEHMAEFESYKPHNLLKRLQVESDTECEHIYIHVEGVGMILSRQANSFSFADMGQERFTAAIQKITEHVQLKYWPEFGMHLLEKVVPE